MVRSPEEILAYYAVRRDTDFLGFTGEVLLSHLPLTMVQSLLPIQLSEWMLYPLTEDAIKEELRVALPEAWQAVRGHQSMIASRNAEHFAAWMYLLGDDGLQEYAEDDTNYNPYGAPILAAISLKYGWPIPADPMLTRMLRGEPCSTTCFPCNRRPARRVKGVTHELAND